MRLCCAAGRTWGNDMLQWLLAIVATLVVGGAVTWFAHGPLRRRHATDAGLAALSAMSWRAFIGIVLLVQTLYLALPLRKATIGEWFPFARAAALTGAGGVLTVALSFALAAREDGAARPTFFLLIAICVVHLSLGIALDITVKLFQFEKSRLPVSVVAPKSDERAERGRGSSGRPIAAIAAVGALLAFTLMCVRRASRARRG